MKMYRLIVVFATLLGLSAFSRGDDDVTIVKKAVARSTLNQSGTKPFHLRATLAPSRDSDRGSKRTGEVEIWWVSPVRWKRELRSPEFHQIAIFNSGKEWQTNEGDYFPEWLRETAVALIDPIPSLDRVLEQVRTADVKKLMGTTHLSWTMMSTDGTVQSGMGAGISITDSTGLLFYGSGFGWGGLYGDYKGFNGRMVARKVSVGSPEVTAKVTVLENLREVPSGFFEAGSNGGDAQPLRTVLVNEQSLRKNLVPMDSLAWPPLKDGPLEGALTAEITVDRTGRVREIGSIVGDNPGLNDVAKAAIAAMRFRPHLENGVPAQVVSRITIPFKTVRPEGMERFESAKVYFDRGGRLSFPAAGVGAPYLLHAEFQARTSNGVVENGQYVDTWINDNEWRREAAIGTSQYVRARHGENWYQLANGPDAALLRIVLEVMEPLPAVDTLVESDWKIRRDGLDDMKTVRVLAGYESPDGTLDPVHARGYWFDETGRLVKTYFSGIETRRSDFVDFGGVQISHRIITILHHGAPEMLIRVTQVSPPGMVPASTFELPGHEWNRAFTAGIR